MMATDLLTKVRKAVQGEQKWALLYMMVEYTDGTNDGMHGPFPADGKEVFGVWPEVHGFYDTEADAVSAQRTKNGDGDGYFVRPMRNYTGSGI